MAQKSQKGQEKVDLERFRSLKANQAKLLLEADCRAMHAVSDNDIDAVCHLYHQAGVPFKFTLETKISYAEQAEKQGIWNVAMRWYQKTGIGAYVHDFIVRHAWIEPDKVDRREFSDDEISKMGKVCLEKGDLENALGFFRLCNDVENIHEVRNAAICCADYELAEKAAKIENSPLTKQECTALLVWMINRGNAGEAIKVARRYKLIVKWREQLVHLVVKSSGSYSEFRIDMQAIGVVPTVGQLEMVYKKVLANGSVPRVVEIAEVLSQKSKKWQKRLPRILLKARNHELEGCSIRLAQEYGKKCGKPLTIEELIGVLDKLRDRAKDDAPQWAVLDYEFAMKYLASQIVRRVGRSR